MTEIRPTQLPVSPAQDARPDLVRLREIATAFHGAMGGGGVAKPAAPSPPAVYAQPVQRLPDPAGEPPTRILRPGSLLDIRV